VDVNLRVPMWLPDEEAKRPAVFLHSARGLFPAPLPAVSPFAEAAEAAGGGGGGADGEFATRSVVRTEEAAGRVLRRFRFLGRLSAAALRDGFVLPLPLSLAFLRLVLKHDPDADAPEGGGGGGGGGGGAGSGTVLREQDLPAPGCVGGEIRAMKVRAPLATCSLARSPTTRSLAPAAH
jgi:hypothetical protein